MDLLRFLVTVIGLVLVLIDLFFLSKLLRHTKTHQWEKAEHSCNAILVLSLFIPVFVFLGAFWGQQDGSFPTRIGLSLLKMVGTVWPFAVAYACLMPTFRKRIRDGKASHPEKEENVEQAGTVPPSVHAEEQDGEK